ncbi:MAG TPA: NUDIX domain-containing protein [Anaerolineae bacterium]|nr:NUDIX domain-containing protein [Anaerolineae bacterium]HQH39348.1 NUDIX domain-containing protein [Anaerolineae bacterium]
MGAVVLQGKQALFVRQAKGQSLEGQWSIPWGIIDSEESPEVAAVRETREESGVFAEIEGLLGVQNLHPPGWIGIVFLCRHVSGIPTSDGGIETDQAAYFSLEQMEAFDEPFEPWCGWLVRRVLQGECHIIPPELNNPYQPHLAFL